MQLKGRSIESLPGPFEEACASLVNLFAAVVKKSKYVLVRHLGFEAGAELVRANPDSLSCRL
jgi:hypothetical protein